ncbi:eCIS core domain-containing protein [Streptomyces sp. NPDC002911]
MTQAIQRSMGVQPDTVGNAELRRAIQCSRHEHGPDHPHGQVDLQRRVEEEPAVQGLSTFHAAQGTPGRPLAPHIQRTAEQAYGMPFGHVRMHDDPVSQQSADELSALAYTSGSDIFIGSRPVNDETVYHEIDHVRQQAMGPVAGTDNGMGAKVSSPRDPFEVSSTANGKRVARGEAPDLTLPGSHGHDGNVQRAAAEPAVQRMEAPRGRPGDRDYEADNSASDSSPERRELHNDIERHFEGMEGLVGRAGRLAEGPGLPRVRRVLPESDSDSPERAAQPPVREQAAPEPLPTLSENSDLEPLHDLLVQDLHEGDLNKKLKVSFQVFSTGNLIEGHAWMEVTGSEGTKVSFGFFPVNGGLAALGSVQGGVRCPDPFVGKRNPTHRESKMVALRDVIRGYELVHERSTQNYNFTLHNCTTFAGDVWRNITGKAIPADFLTAIGLLSMAISTPQAAADGLGSHQEQRTNDRRERMLPFAEGPMRGVIPGSGTPEEIADRFARARQSQSSSSESTEEVD